MAQYAIYEENFDRLQKKITTIANKCSKFGCEFKFEVVGSEIRKVTDDEGNQRNCRFILVEAEGTAKLNDWEFIASIEHKEGGNIIRTFNKDAEIPTRYFTSDPICEHCNSKRRRNKTCLVRNIVTGEWKQVGLSCLKDFTCGLSAEDVTRYISFFDNLIEGEAPYSGSWGKPYWYISEYLPYAVECVKRFGYFNSYSNYPTSTRAFSYFEVDALNRKFMGSESIEKEMFDCKFEVTEESKKLAEETINWCKHLSNETDPYMHNLEVIFFNDYFARSELGFVTSSIKAYMRHKDIEDKKRKEAIERAKAAQKSSHKYNEGDKVQLEVVNFKYITSFDNMYGTTHLDKFEDKEGNVYSWFASSGCDEEKVKSIKGTVKSNGEYNGVKETRLTRCRVSC